MKLKYAFLIACVMLNSMAIYADEEDGILDESSTEFYEEESTVSEEELIPDYENAEILVMKKRQFSFKELLNAYYGEDNWDIENLTVSGTEHATYTAPDEEYSLRLACTAPGSFYIDVDCGEVENPDAMIREWRYLLEELDIPLTEDHSVWQMGDFVRYHFYVQHNGIKFCPEDIVIGNGGNEVWYRGQAVIVDVDEQGYDIACFGISEVVSDEKPENPRTLLTEEEVDEIVVSYVSAFAGQGNLIQPGKDDVIRIEPAYIMVDQGTRKDESVFDIGFLYKRELDYTIEMEGIVYPYCINAIIDGQFPFILRRQTELDYERGYIKTQEDKNEVEE